MKVRVLIAQGDAICRQHLRKLLEAETQVEVVGVCADGEEALKAIRRVRPDLIFLEVQLPRLDGFSVLKRLNGVHPVIIVVTAQDRFALKAFEVDAADCLMKPFDPVRFRAALRRGRERVRSNALLQKQSVRKALSTRASELDRLTISMRGRILVVKTLEVDWICSAGNYVELHVGPTTHLLRTSLSALFKKLPKSGFLRISRSSIINLDRIKEIRPRAHGDYTVILQDSTVLNGSRNFRVGTPGLLQRTD